MKMHTVKKYRFYPSCLFFLQDKWLMKQAKKGLQLIDYGIFTYTFISVSPQTIFYFSYTGLGGPRNGEAKYDLRLRHPFLEKVYGRSHRKSVLNNNVRKKRRKVIIEIDPQKMNYAYDELVHDRNKWHFYAWLNTYLLLFLGIMGIVLILWIEKNFLC